MKTRPKSVTISIAPMLDAVRLPLASTTVPTTYLTLALQLMLTYLVVGYLVCALIGERPSTSSPRMSTGGKIATYPHC